MFGEISELYVSPEHRSKNAGQMLIEVAMQKAAAMNWKRIEVGSPPEQEWAGTISFYETKSYN